MSETQFVCPIWNTPAILLAGSRTDAGVKVFSLRAGGQYRMSNEAMDDHPILSDSQRAILTTWLVDQRRLGTRAPLLSTDGIEAILATRSLRFGEKKERFFRGFAELKPGRRAWFMDDFGGSHDDLYHPQKVLAFMGAETFREAMAIVLMLRDDGFLTYDGKGFEFTGKGFDTLDALDRGANSLQAFVAMWFGEEMKEAWRAGFAPAIRDAGYEPFRIDNLEHNGKIDDAIVAQIKRSRFLIADFTCGGVQIKGKFQPNPRGGVYYEAGLAHGLGMEVIFTCRRDRLEYLHFDTRQFAHIVWDAPSDLRSQLYNRIAATVREAPDAPGPGKGAVDPSDPVEPKKTPINWI